MKPLSILLGDPAGIPAPGLEQRPPCCSSFSAVKTPMKSITACGWMPTAPWPLPPRCMPLWKLLEASPEKTKPLSVFDQLAYGIAQQTVTEHGVSFSLKALETKRMKARATPTAPPGTCAPMVLTDIQGQEAL